MQGFKPAYHTAVVLAMLVASAGSVCAEVRNIVGSQSGTTRFQWFATFTTSGTAVQFRIPTPTAFGDVSSSRTQDYEVVDWSLDVVDAINPATPVTWQPVLVNAGEINSVTFVQVHNPHPVAFP